MKKAFFCRFVILALDLILVASGELDATMEMVLMGGAILGALGCLVTSLDPRVWGWALLVFGVLHLPLGAFVIWGLGGRPAALRHRPAPRG